MTNQPLIKDIKDRETLEIAIKNTIEDYKEAGIKLSKKKCLSIQIRWAFCWSDTKQGREFWEEINQQILNQKIKNV